MAGPPKSLQRQRNAETITGALAILALVNLAVVLFCGGYDIALFGVQVRAHTPARPLYAVVLFLGARMLVSLRGQSLSSMARGLYPWGVAAAAAGTAVFLYIVRSPLLAVPGWGVGLVWAVTVAGFAFAWLAYRPHLPAAAGIVVALVYLPFSAALADSLLYRDAWKKDFNLPSRRYDPRLEIPAARHGLLGGAGTDVKLVKVKVDNDWRDAAAISPGGFLSARAEATAGAVLRFSAALRGSPAGRASVTLVAGRDRKELWSAEAGTLSDRKWTDVSLPLELAGPADIVFEAGGSGAGKVLFANPRIMPSTRPAGAPNVILMVVDALRADRLGVYGCERATSAGFDRLAARGVIFDDFMAQSSWTLPSMASIFTGLYPTAHGVRDTDIPLSPVLETLADRFALSGYLTAAIQSSNVMAPQRGMAKGFAEYQSVPYPGGDYTCARAEEVNARALAWIDAHSAQAPFFLYVHYMDVHSPYEPPQAYRRFGDTDSGLYDGSILYWSDKFAGCFAEIEKRGLLKNTILVVTSDHGEQFREHGGLFHGGSLYSEETHVPLVVWAPGARAGRVKGRAKHVDLPATLLEMARLPALPNASGRSLAPAIAGAPLAPEKCFSEVYPHNGSEDHLLALADDRYCMILSDPDLAPRWQRLELYDLSGDPGERLNLAGSRPDVTAAMADEARSFYGAQRTINAKLVPAPVRIAISEEDRLALEALGYVTPGSERK